MYFKSPDKISKKTSKLFHFFSSLTEGGPLRRKHWSIRWFAQINAGLGILGVLDHNKQVVPVRGHHDLMLLKNKEQALLIYHERNKDEITIVLILKKWGRLWDNFQGWNYLCSDPKESEVICGIKLLEHGLSLVHKVVEKSTVLDCGRVVQGWLDWHLFSILLAPTGALVAIALCPAVPFLWFFEHLCQ